MVATLPKKMTPGLSRPKKDRPLLESPHLNMLVRYADFALNLPFFGAELPCLAMVALEPSIGTTGDRKVLKEKSPHRAGQFGTKQGGYFTEIHTLNCTDKTIIRAFREES